MIHKKGEVSGKRKGERKKKKEFEAGWLWEEVILQKKKTGCRAPLMAGEPGTVGTEEGINRWWRTGNSHHISSAKRGGCREIT